MGWMNQVCGENEDDYIEVKKKYLTMLEAKSKELEIYKKALELACSQNNTNPICATAYQRDNCMLFGSCGKCWENVCLQKAREE